MSVLLKQMGWKSIFWFLYMGGIIVLMLFVSMYVTEAFFSGETADDCIYLDEGLTYETSDGQSGTVTLPDTIHVTKGETITLTASLPKRIKKGYVLAYYPYHQSASVYINGTLRARYNGTDSIFESNLPSKGVRFVDLYREDAGGELSITFSSEEKRYIGVFNTLEVGERYDIYRTVFHHGTFVMIVGLFLVYYGMILLGVSMTAVHNKAILMPYIYLGMTAALAGAWFVLQTNIGQVFTGNTAWLQWMETLALAMVPFPLARFVDICEGGYYRKIFDVISVIDVAVVVIDFALTFLGRDMLSAVWLIHMALGCSMVGTAITIILLRFRNKEIYDNIRWVTVASIVLILCGLTEIALYYVDPQKEDGTFFVIGVLTFLFCCFIWVRRQHISQTNEEQEISEQARMKNVLLENISTAIRQPADEVQKRSAHIMEKRDGTTTGEAAKKVHEESLKLLALLDDVVNYVKLDAGVMTTETAPYETKLLVRQLYRQAKTYHHNPDVRFECHVDSNMPQVLEGDLDKLRQMTTALLAAAFRYTAEGAVRLNVGFSAIGSVRRGILVINVQDTGRGVPDTVDAEKLFSPDNIGGAQDGPELTLSVVGGMCRLLGGDVKLKATGERGTDITLSVPQHIVDGTAVGAIAGITGRKV